MGFQKYSFNNIFLGPFIKKQPLLLFYAFIGQLLDFVSIILLVPVLISIFNTGAEFKSDIPVFVNIMHVFKNHQTMMLSGVVAFYILKNALSIRITKFQSDFYYRLSSILSLKLLRNYFEKSLLEVKSERNSALLKDIVFIPNNYVTYVLSPAIQLISELFLLLLILFCALFINPLLTFFLVVIVAVIAISLYYYDRKQMAAINDVVSEKYDANFNILMNAVNGYMEIKTNQAEEHFLDKFNKSNAALNQIYSALTANRLIKPKYTETFLILIISSLFLLFHYFSTDGSLNLLFISFLFASSIKIIPSINRILIGLTNIKSNLYTVAILKKSAVEKPETTIPTEKILFEEKIELQQINFNFEGSKKLLDNISLTINKGEIIGIFGDSGNGKSTLVNIITSFIIPDSGKLLCDGIEINATNKNAYLQNLSYIPQSPFILEGSILDNLLLKDKPLPEAELNEYLEQLDLKKTIDALPEKLNTFIGSNGYALSGGQIQRLAIIRALIRNPKLLLLDEATNQLDATLSHNVLAAIKSISRQKNITILTISHNKNELGNFCDRIFELKNSNLILK